MQCVVFWRTAANMAVAGSLLAAGCSQSGADRGGPFATVATEPAATTTTNPYAVPAIIDVAYVNHVLAGLDAAIGDVTRLVVRTKTIPPEAYDRLKALYADPNFLQIQIDNFQADMRKNFVGYKPIPGNKTTSVFQLISRYTYCIFARVQREYSAVGTNPSDALHTSWVALRPLDQARDPQHYNPTPWSYVYDGFPPDHTQPPDPCAT